MITRRIGKLSFIIVCVLALCASPLAAQHFYFVQMTDTHFGLSDNAARVAKVIDSINNSQLKLDCVVLTGDITNEILDAKGVTEALDVMKSLRLPVHYLPGNHDIGNGGDIAAKHEVFTKNFGPVASKAEYHGVVFLIVYTEPLRTGVQVSGYDPLKWLERSLKEAGNKPVIIFTHVPDTEDFGGKDWPQEARVKWEALIKSHSNIKAVLTGHTHRDELHWIGKVPQYVCPPVASLFGRQITYRCYEYIDGRLGYQTVYVD